jgi:type II secretory pathway component PulK
MKFSAKKNPRRGFALIIAMLAIFVLATMAATLAFSMKVETKLAFTANDDQRMIWLARSAVEEARCGLKITAGIPGEQFRALNQWWATGIAGPIETNYELIDFPQNTEGDNGQRLIPPSQGVATFTMVDLDRYININTAPAPLLQNAFSDFGADADDISIASDSIQDWVQSGDSPRIAGAKNDYYQSLDPPYYCKEAPMDNLSELKSIRGIQDSDPTSNQAVGFHHQLGFGNAMGQGNPITYQGLTNLDVFTPFSSGRININTAPLNVLAAIAGGDTGTGGDTNDAETIIEYREGANNDDTLDPSIKNLGQLTAAGISPQIIQKFATYCGVTSSIYRVDVTVTIGQDTPGHFHAILFQHGKDVDIVNFYSDQ